MSKRKPKIEIHSSSLEGKREASFEIPPDEEKTQFNTNLPVSLVEKLRAMAFYEQRNMNDIVAETLALRVAREEAERGEPYDVLPTHRVRSSRR